MERYADEKQKAEQEAEALQLPLRVSNAIVEKQRVTGRKVVAIVMHPDTELALLKAHKQSTDSAAGCTRILGIPVDIDAAIGRGDFSLLLANPSTASASDGSVKP